MRTMTDLLGCGNGLVSRWSRGERKPGALWRIVMRDKIGIAIEAWDRPVEKSTQRSKRAA